MENEKNAPNNNQPELTDTEKKLKADHDALYWKYSQKTASLYKVAELAFNSNPDTILELDEDVKDKIVKEKFWVNSFIEAQAILGEDFYKRKDEWDNHSDLEKTVAELMRDKKVSDYKTRVEKEESEIELFITKNPTIFEWIENPKDLLKNEIKKLADNTPIAEKLEDASALVRVKYSKKVDFANTTSWWNKVINTEWVKRNPSLARIFWNKI